MKIIAVTGYKGGVGKSTTAIHIATYLSRFGKVLLVDGDPNRTSISWAARGALPCAVTDLVSCSSSQDRAMRVFQGRDYIVIDTPARPRSDDLAELANGSSLMILPTSPDIVSLDPMLQTMKDLRHAPCMALLTIVPPKPSREGETLLANLKAHDVPVFNTLIRRSVGFQKAALAGLPLRDMTGRDRLAWLDYEALGEEVMTYLENKVTVAPEEAQTTIVPPAKSGTPDYTMQRRRAASSSRMQTPPPAKRVGPPPPPILKKHRRPQHPPMSMQQPGA